MPSAAYGLGIDIGDATVVAALCPAEPGSNAPSGTLFCGDLAGVVASCRPGAT